MTTADVLTQNTPSSVPCLVLLGGTLGDETVWRDVIERLGATVTTLCRRTDTGSTVREIASAALEAAPAVFSLAGHSFGGIVALEMQRQAPLRVERIALLNASAGPGSIEQQQSWSALRARVLTGDFSSVAQELAYTTLPEHHRDARLIARNLDMANTVGASGFLRQLNAQASRPDSRPTLPDIDVPTLLVAGEHDEVCPPERQHEIATSIPGSTMELITGSGHMSPLEAPNEVAALLNTWLSTSSILGVSTSRTSAARAVT